MPHTAALTGFTEQYLSDKYIIPVLFEGMYYFYLPGYEEYFSFLGRGLQGLERRERRGEAEQRHP